MTRLRTITLLAVATLIAAGTAHAEVTQVNGLTTLEGKGRCKASGLGGAKMYGHVEFRAEGLGTVKAPAGILYRTDRSRRVRFSDGEEISGFGWIEMRLEGLPEATPVEVGALATLKARSHRGQRGTVVLEGNGTVKYAGFQVSQD